MNATAFLIVLGSVSFLPLQLLGAARVVPTELRCEYLQDPEGIDTVHPRLSWVLEPTKASVYGQHQSAYQILVASTESRLARDEADLWDTGRVRSSESVLVDYAGAELATGQRCYWKVRVWDRDGNRSDWSPSARWSMGLVTSTDWASAEWLGLDEPDSAFEVTGMSWIWFPEGDPTAAAPVGHRYFRRVFDLSGMAELDAVRLVMAADNEYVAFLNGEEVGKGTSFKTADEFDLSDKLRAGRNVLAVRVRNAGDSPNPAALTARMELIQSQGAERTIHADHQWKVVDQEIEGWQRLETDDTAWRQAKVLGPVGMAPWGEISGRENRRLPARWLRKEFSVNGEVTRATAYFSGLGLSELYLNGRKVGDHVLSPGLTEYTRRVYYVTHDVTPLLRQGANAVGAILGNGRYFAPRLKEPTETRTYGFPKMLLRLRLEYADGTEQDLVSDASWRLSCDGPIQANCEYDGEYYDARKEFAGWAEPGFDDGAWETVQRVASPGGTLVAQMIEPIRVIELVKPVSIEEVAPGTFIYDFGQNMVGWCRLKVAGPRGTTVTLRHAEILKPGGHLYLDNIRGAKVTDTYILRGTGTEQYEPRFTYHGFRYVELEGYPGQPTLDTLRGCVVHDDLAPAGTWESSHSLLNRIHENVRWGVRGNYRSIPTDCPQRDERRGWLGDRSAESKGEAFLYHTAALYAKWLQDMEDAQKPNGSVPDVCPAYWPMYSDNVTWPSSTVIIPEHLLTQFGDRSIIARHYPSMKRWMDHMATYLKGDLMPRDQYGDWCVPPEDPRLIHSQDPARETHPTILGSTYYYHCLRLMSRYAALVGKDADAVEFDALARRIRVAFNHRFLASTADHYDNGSQTSSVLPLAFDLVPTSQRAAVFDHWVAKIVGETGNHVGTGLIGGQRLMRTLSDGGRPDLAYTLATQRTYPSWGYMIDQGATTIWELWNGDTADPAMNSGNHVMLVGDLIIWMYEYLAGIQSDPQQPGFKHILMKPHPVGDLGYVRATHRSPYGLIRSAWQRNATSFSWEITVPVNSTATVFMPAVDPTRITVNGQPLRKARERAAFLRMQKGYALLAVGSGNYKIVSRDP